MMFCYFFVANFKNVHAIHHINHFMQISNIIFLEIFRKYYNS